MSNQVEVLFCFEVNLRDLPFYVVYKLLIARVVSWKTSNVMKTLLSK